VGDRAKWLVSLCESKGWYILNGIQPGPPARFTFERGKNKSCIDLILASDSTRRVEHDPSTLKTISDHVLVTTTVEVKNFKETANKQTSQKESREVIYKWKEGTCVQNYAESA
jgi:F420-0:gamma-glutamyl ligase